MNGRRPIANCAATSRAGISSSACALAFASSGEEELKRNGDLMVAELAKCRAQHKNGYLSAFPVTWFDRLRDLVRVWAPFLLTVVPVT